MAASRSVKKTIPTLIRNHGDNEEKNIAFGRHIPGVKEPKKAQRSLNRNFKSLGSQDLSEENAMLRESLQKLDKDHRKMEEELENTVKEAHGRLENMKELLEKRAKAHSEAFDEVTQKNENLEELVSKYEKKLISENIDPVSLENTDPSEVDGQAVEEKRKISKGKVKQMREKLRDMNQKTQTYLDDLQNMKRQIEELEEVSSRISMGGDSDEETLIQQSELPSTVFLTQAAGNT